MYTDVVPVHPDTVSQWIHPPYSGFFDGTSLSEHVYIILTRIPLQGENIWGRGSVDDKGGLIGILCVIIRCTLILAHTAWNDNSSAIESLLEAKFKPRRSVVLAFGFDEESSSFEVSFSMHVHRPEPFLKHNI